MKHNLVISAAFMLTACGAASSSSATKNAHPFIGCWQSTDGLDYEGWSMAPNGWLLGYAINQNAEGDVTFFEQMRIETDGDREVLVVSGGEDGTTVRFKRKKTNNPTVYHFTNPEHDYPQAITYRPDGMSLNAEISLLDGSKARPFPKRACKL